MAQNVYVMFKGTLKLGVPFLQGYKGDPHYVIVVDDTQGGDFEIVTNVKSDSSLSGAAGYNVLYALNPAFVHPMVSDLAKLPVGLAQSGFPKLDYVHDPQLVDLTTMKPIPLDTATEHNDINALVNQMLELDLSAPPVEYVYTSKSGKDQRRGWKPSKPVTVYGFGFLFEPEHDGLHETHMNQGNPKPAPGSHQPDHSSENGTYQDGAVIIEVDGQFQALFVAFQTQLIPTDNRGWPIPGTSHPILG